jgi:hypothetical protein
LALLLTQVKESLSSFGGYAAVRAGKPQVLVMGYTTFRMHREAVVRKGVDIVICDEVGAGWPLGIVTMDNEGVAPARHEPTVAGDTFPSCKTTDLDSLAPRRMRRPAPQAHTLKNGESQLTQVRWAGGWAGGRVGG